MLYIKKTTSVQEVTIPRNLSMPTEGKVTLALADVMGDGEVATTVESIDIYDRVYVVGVKLPKKVAEGEYEYTLRIGNAVVATGIAQVGDYKGEIISYEQETDIEQYDDTFEI